MRPPLPTRGHTTRLVIHIQSSRASFHQERSPSARTHGRTELDIHPAPALALQRAAAQLIERIPALRTIVGIDTDHWTDIGIGHALNHDGTTHGWTWPTAEAMTAPLRLVAHRISRLDWTGPFRTEHKIHGREQSGETAADAAHRLIQAYRHV